MLLYLLHKMYRFVYGTTACAGLAFVHYQNKKPVIPDLAFGLQLIVVGCPSGGKLIQLGLYCGYLGIS
jgi:hypothetical protein